MTTDTHSGSGKEQGADHRVGASWAVAGLALVSCLLASCGTCRVDLSKHGDMHNGVLISVEDQRLTVMDCGRPIRSFKVSTSKFGLGDEPGSYKTPLGRFKVAHKIGNGAQIGQVFKGRRRTSEIIEPNSMGRDPVVTRIMWLKGMDSSNRNAYRRLIYIHGTPEEKRLGQPVSYGCVRMASDDIVELFRMVRRGTPVKIVRESLAPPLLAGIFRRDVEPGGDDSDHLVSN